MNLKLSSAAVRVGIAGSRWAELNLCIALFKRSKLLPFATTIVTGKNPGVEHAAFRWAVALRLQHERLSRDEWLFKGRAELPFNQYLVKLSHGLVIISDFKDFNIRYLLNEARQKGIPVCCWHPGTGRHKYYQGHGNYLDIWDGALERAAIMEEGGRDSYGFTDLKPGEAEWRSGERAFRRLEPEGSILDSKWVVPKYTRDIRDAPWKDRR